VDIERAIEKASELVLDDEAWRDGIEDSLATPLLDWTLAQLDIRLTAAAESGALDEDLPYAMADQARAMLATVCHSLRTFAQGQAAGGGAAGSTADMGDADDAADADGAVHVSGQGPPT
jgi:hypothetical protein